MTQEAFAFLTGLAMSLVLAVIVGNHMFRKGMSAGLRAGREEGFKAGRRLNNSGIADRMILIGAMHDVIDLEKQLSEGVLPDELTEVIKEAISAHKIIDVTSRFNE